jgi:uridine phosphorylase
MENNRVKKKTLTAADLPVDDQGRIYHLQVKPGQVASDVLIVGDPGRAEYIGSHFFSAIEFEHEHRGLVTITGTSRISGGQATIVSPLRTTVTTSGIGTPSLEIVVNELVLMNEVDFETRTRKSTFPRLHVIRVGTSGGLQAATRLGTPIITTHAIGMDNTGLYYEIPHPDADCQRLEGELDQLMRSSMPDNSRFHGKIHPYVTRAEPVLVAALQEAATELGIEVRTGLTISAPGFSAPQGRATARVKASLPDVDEIFSRFDPHMDGQRVENMEMEASFLLHFLGGLGYWAGAICPAIANRRNDTFDPNYQQAITNATNIALLALANIRKRYPNDQTIIPLRS